MSQPATDAPPTRGHKKKERTRRQLITAAVDVIAARGEAFSVSDITTRAGVANGTFYNYFADRDALIDAIVPEVLGRFAAESAATVVDDDPAVRFAAISALALTRAIDAPDEMRVVLRLDAAQEAIIGAAPLGHLRDDIAAGFAAGRFTTEPSEAVLDVIVGSLLMAVRRIVHGQGGTDYATQIVEQLLRSLGVDHADSAAVAEAAAQRARVMQSA